MEEKVNMEPAAWRVGFSYWTHRDSIPALLLPPADNPEPLYTAEQVRQAVLEERERCAKLCEAIASGWISGKEFGASGPEVAHMIASTLRKG